MIKMSPEQIFLPSIFCMHLYQEMSGCLVQECGSCDFDLLLQVQITDSFFYRTTFFAFDILYVYELRHDSVT